MWDFVRCRQYRRLKEEVPLIPNQKITSDNCELRAKVTASQRRMFIKRRKCGADGVKLMNMHIRRYSTFSFVSACNMNGSMTRYPLSSNGGQLVTLLELKLLRNMRSNHGRFVYVRLLQKCFSILPSISRREIELLGSLISLKQNDNVPLHSCLKG